MKQMKKEIVMTFNGMCNFFKELYIDEIDRVEVEIPSMTIENIKNMTHAASEFCYTLDDMSTRGGITELSFDYDYVYSLELDDFEEM